jgi:hypothetical protein
MFASPLAVEDAIQQAPWFGRMGQARASNVILPAQDLTGYAQGGPWEELRNLPPSLSITWLPTTRDQGDPFWGDQLSVEAVKADRVAQVRDATLRVFGLTLSRLRVLDGDARFTVGEHVLVESARGAALHAMRNLVREVALEKPGEWTRLGALFLDGYWPLAVLGDGRALVF